MTMLAAMHSELSTNSLFGSGDEFTGFLDTLYDDHVLYSDVDVFSYCLEERTEICNSVSSSACPSPSSEVSCFDIGLDETLDAFLFDRGVDLLPSSPPKISTYTSCKQRSLPQFSKKKNLCFSALSNHKWSNASSFKQRETLEDLMNTVSQKLGLREQLDVIKIINPDATLLPNDTEFFIDFELMNDKKFNQIKLYVEKQLKSQQSCDEKDKERKKVSNCKADEKKKTKTNRLEQKSKDEKLMRLDKCKVRHEKRAKKSKQLRKELKSGLFAKEQVISVETWTAETDTGEEEIDILT